MERWGCKARFRQPFIPYTLTNCTTHDAKCARGNPVMSATQDTSEHRNLGIIRGPGKTGDPGRSDEISLSDLIRVLRRRKQIIFTSVMVAFLLGSLYCGLKT